MKNLKKCIAAKLKSAAGESLAEVLIALLIAAMAMAMLATAISSTARIVTRSKTAMKEYYDGNNALEAASSGNEYTEVIGLTIVFDGVWLTDPEGPDDDSESFDVSGFWNKKSGEKVPVISYKLSS